MKNPTRNMLASAIAGALLFASAAHGSDRDASPFKTHVYPDSVMIEPLADAAFDASVDLIVRGPDGFRESLSFPAGSIIEFDPQSFAGGALADGLYRYETRVTGLSTQRIRGQDAIPMVSALAEPHGGSFTILDGQFVSPDRVEESQLMVGSKVHPPTSTLNNDSDGGGRDQVIADDLIVDGSACIGTDCVNGENFGFDTLRLKENNTRLKFDDTSNSGSFPNTDWQLTANDSNNGGANKFSIEDTTNARIPFTIEANAPNHSMFVDDGGRIGMGTMLPVVQMHTLDGNTPTLRLDQDGSSGFTPQAWDVAGNEANFFIRDATNGSTLPFRIQPGAPSDALYISSSGNIGLGDNSPDHPLVIERSDDTAQVRVVDTGTSNGQTMFSLEKNGHPRFRLRNTSLDSNWDMRTAGSGASEQFQITNISGGSSAFPMRVFKNGDVEIEGTLTEASSRSLKHSVESLEAPEVLAKVIQLDITKWRYNNSPEALHVGPMAEDWHEAFGLGSDNTTVSPRDLASVALIASQALADEIEQRDRRISELEARLAELEQAVSNQAR